MQSALTRLAELADAYPYLAILQNHGLAHPHVAVARTRGQRGRCYGNALARAMDEPGHIHYVEGLAVHPRTGLVLRHAWVEDDNGTPLEVTWLPRPDGSSSACGSASTTCSASANTVTKQSCQSWTQTGKPATDT